MRRRVTKASAACEKRDASGKRETGFKDVVASIIAAETPALSSAAPEQHETRVRVQWEVPEFLKERF